MLRYRASAILLLLLSYGFINDCRSGEHQKVASTRVVMISAHPLAAEAGLQVYRNGGNVVDAAVATAYALGVVEPHGSGIGGEGMMLIYLAAERKYVVIDFKAIAPAKATYATLDFSAVSSWNKTVRGASVPGAVAGLELAREKFGRLDRASDLAPAIAYAKNGFIVDSTLAGNLAADRRLLGRDPYAKKIYYAGNEPLKAGTLIRNPDYAKSLEAIRDDGPDAFYRGRIARLIVADARKHGGFIDAEDLAAYAPVIREPLVGEYRGYRVVTTPPPCGGMFLLETLNMLKYFDLAACRAADGYDLHIEAEVFKRIYKDELTFNGDPAFGTIPAGKVASQSFAFRRMSDINLAKASDALETPPGRLEDKNTTQLCVMDSAGNTVSLTITLSSLFGTAHTVEGAGFFLNNEMQNFNPDSTHPNSLKPHKRVVTSLVPTILEKDGRPALTLGTPGGDVIISTVAQVIVNVVDLHESPGEAVAAPRIFSTFYQKEVELENRFPEADLEFLRKLGHDLRPESPYRAYFGAVQFIGWDPKTRLLTGSADPRRSGAAVGE